MSVVQLRKCAYCECLSEGNYTLPLENGATIWLCDKHGSTPEPSCDEIEDVCYSRGLDLLMVAESAE